MKKETAPGGILTQDLSGYRRQAGTSPLYHCAMTAASVNLMLRSSELCVTNQFTIFANFVEWTDQGKSSSSFRVILVETTIVYQRASYKATALTKNETTWI